MDGFYLKIIALAAMFIDHTGSILDLMPMRYIGRIAFPIYAFLIAEGCMYTKNIKKYMFRLFIFGLASQVPFAIFTESVTFFSYLNIFFTLSLGVLSIYTHKLIMRKVYNANLRIILIFLSLFGLAAVAELINTDYGSIGVVWIYCFYICKSSNISLVAVKLIQAVVVLAFLLLLYPISTTHGLYLFLGGSISLMPILLYDGKKGKSIKWFFYVFYPSHLIVLIFLRYYFL